jgi:hypothetical protein
LHFVSWHRFSDAMSRLKRRGRFTQWTLEN